MADEDGRDDCGWCVSVYATQYMIGDWVLSNCVPNLKNWQFCRPSTDLPTYRMSQPAGGQKARLCATFPRSHAGIMRASYIIDRLTAC